MIHKIGFLKSFLKKNYEQEYRYLSKIATPFDADYLEEEDRREEEKKRRRRGAME